MRIALVGTRGVPARYGGFETAVEEVGRRLVQSGHEVVVYCRRSPRGPRGGRSTEPLPTRHLGMELVHLPAVRHKVLETLSHTALSAAHLARERLAGRRVDAAVVFNSANAPVLPVLRRLGIPVATHVDGLEWKRAKWTGLGRRYYRIAESLAVRWSDALISDARGIEEYYREEFRAGSEYIAYGAPQLATLGADRLAEMGLARHGYHLLVARFEPENHVRMAVEGYARSTAALPLVVVGSAPYGAAYTARIEAAAAASGDRVRLVGPVWDQELLDQLYVNCLTYVHGHSVGGTNPSLLRAMGAGAATLAYDVVFNREVLGSAGRWFATPEQLAVLLQDAEADVPGTVGRGLDTAREAQRYDWDGVADAYAKLCHTLVFDGRRDHRPSGRRTGLWSGDHVPVPVPTAAVRPLRGRGDVAVGAGVGMASRTVRRAGRGTAEDPSPVSSLLVDVGSGPRGTTRVHATAPGPSPAPVPEREPAAAS